MTIEGKIRVPKRAAAGETVGVRVLIRHPMETGFRRDDAGRAAPYNVVEEVVCRYGGREVFRARFSSGVAANPYLLFYLRADASGEIEATWRDMTGATGSARARLDVIPG